MENSKNSSLSKLIPVMLCFFAMGFVDLVGIASNYVKADLGLSDSQANIFPSLVFFWFLIFSVPTGMLMSRIGQKKTVLLSLLVTFASLLLPVFGDSYMLMLISFSLLGIGNALMQTSLNPLLSNIVRGDRLASSLTFGQFVKAIASFLAPYIAMWGATQAIPSFDLGWRILFPVYMIVAVVAILLLNATQIEEEKEEGKPSTFGQCLALLGKLCFFAMGFVDLVGIASNYVKADLGLSDSQANIFPSLVFFWFLIFSVPTGMLMSRIGQKKTVLLSLLVTFASLLLPVFGDSYMLMLISFSLLGIGNALMQTSLNPLLSNIVRGDRLASSLTFGQFVKAIASFLAPYIAMWGATQAIPSFDLGWRILFPVYMIVAVVAILLLNATQIEEEKEEGKPSTFGQCLALLGKPFILLCFVGIMCHVGIDVGTNTTAPKILMERIGMGLDDAAFATSLYFIFRTAGCFLGSFILRKMSAKSFFAVSVIMMLAAMIGLFIFHEKAIIYVCIALIGFGNSNVFSVIFSQALLYLPGKKNEVSGLMIMGLFGGTVFPLAMGVASDTSMGQNGAIAVMTVGVLYLLFYTFRIRK